MHLSSPENHVVQSCRLNSLVQYPPHIWLCFRSRCVYSECVSHTSCIWKTALLSQRCTVYNTYCIGFIYSFLPSSCLLLYFHLPFPPHCLARSQASRAQWPCFLSSCWTITWPPGSSASGTASLPWASPSAARLWEAWCSLSSGNRHQCHCSVHHLTYWNMLIFYETMISTVRKTWRGFWLFLYKVKRTSTSSHFKGWNQIFFTVFKLLNGW